MPRPLAFYTDSDVSRLSSRDAIAALRSTLAEGFDPAHDAERTGVDLPGDGELLLMPSATASASGVKVLTVAPEDPTRTTPRIQGTYLLFDGASFSPVAVIDGEALTNLRTPAVSFAAIIDLLDQDSAPLEVVFFGTGPQAQHHARMLREIMADHREVRITTLSRTEPDESTLGDQGLGTWAEATSDTARERLAVADLVICMTTAKDPIVSLGDLMDNRPEDHPAPIVVAVGSHTPDHRELAGDLVGAGLVIVEDIGVATRECGDIIQAIDEGHITVKDVHTLAEVATGACDLVRIREESPRTPIVVKTAGQPWEDLAIAQAVHTLARAAMPE